MNPRIGLLAALLIAGCGTVPPRTPAKKGPETQAQAEARREAASRPKYNLAGYPPAVRDGYIDGCETAKRTQYGRKDAQRFANDGQYQMGWNDGFAICGKK